MSKPIFRVFLRVDLPVTCRCYTSFNFLETLIHITDDLASCHQSCPCEGLDFGLIFAFSITSQSAIIAAIRYTFLQRAHSILKQLHYISLETLHRARDAALLISSSWLPNQHQAQNSFFRNQTTRRVKYCSRDDAAFPHVVFALDY